MAEEWRRDGYQISTDPSKLDLHVVHRWLSESSYWVPGIQFDVVRRGVEGSLNFGLYAEGGARTIGLARIITDYATFAYVCDVFVLDEFRGQGLGVWLMECVAAHPRLQGFRRWMLGTKDAHTGSMVADNAATPTRRRTTMKAAVYYETGAPEVFRYEDVPDPQLHPKGVLIDVQAIGIEGGDVLNRAGGALTSQPHIVGYNCAGVVREAGAEVSDRKAGDRVTALMASGSHASMVAVPATST
ncbi:MAG: GNAT family N-acetyltransferase, partial [Dehalococcoidia bacterium]